MATPWHLLHHASVALCIPHSAPRVACCVAAAVLEALQLLHGLFSMSATVMCTQIPVVHQTNAVLPLLLSFLSLRLLGPPVDGWVLLHQAGPGSAMGGGRGLQQRRERAGAQNNSTC
jgi:hypothetical protein